MTLYVNQSTLDTLSGHAVDAWPEECCGILLGRIHENDVHVTKVVSAANIAEGDRRRSYQIDWKVLFEAFRSVRGGSDPVIGFYHSHPDGSNKPSQRDLQSAWVNYRYVILTLHDGCCTDATCWRTAKDHSPFTNEPIARSPWPHAGDG